MSELDQYLVDNPDLVQEVNGYAGVGDPVRMGMQKPDSGFRDVLKEIKRKNYGSKLNTWE